MSLYQPHLQQLQPAQQEIEQCQRDLNALLQQASFCLAHRVEEAYRSFQEAYRKAETLVQAYEKWLQQEVIMIKVPVLAQIGQVAALLGRLTEAEKVYDEACTIASGPPSAKVWTRSSRKSSARGRRWRRMLGSRLICCLRRPKPFAVSRFSRRKNALKRLSTDPKATI